MCSPARRAKLSPSTGTSTASRSVSPQASSGQQHKTTVSGPGPSQERVAWEPPASSGRSPSRSKGCTASETTATVVPSSWGYSHWKLPSAAVTLSSPQVTVSPGGWGRAPSARSSPWQAPRGNRHKTAHNSRQSFFFTEQASFLQAIL